MTASSRQLALARFPLLLAALAAPTLSACSDDPEYNYQIEEVKVVDRRPGSLEPEESLEVEYHWLEALDRSEIGDQVDVAFADDLFADGLELALEDLYVELWHDGTTGVEDLLEGLRGCDPDARIRFGRTLFVDPSELEPVSHAPLEVRYLQGDENGLAAAELLSSELRERCGGAARELVGEAIDRYGLELRGVDSLDYLEQHGRRCPLVVVLSTRAGAEEVSDL